MPNENAPVCGCGVVVDLPKCRSGSSASRKLTLFIPKSKGAKSEGKSSRKQQQEDCRASKSGTPESGSSSSVTEYAARPNAKSNKQDKRLNHARRTRSADRAESHYTYIDSSSSILSGGLREDTIPEALYATIPDTPSASASECGADRGHSVNNIHNNRPQPIYAVPSMTSPPPTYDVAIAKTWQTGLPPTYEEYLCHKYAMISRSHTPPPPWSDSASNQSATFASASSIQQTRRDLAELREYLERRLGNERNHHYQQAQQPQQPQQPQQQARVPNQQILREQQVRAQQRTRPAPTRSHSESRAQQQRVATMYEDGAFCMETTALQSAFDNGIALCSLM